MRITLKGRHKRSDGFTLLEVAVALLIAGVFASGVLALFSASSRQQDLDLTSRNMDYVLEALAVFAESAGRLPCPADPAQDDELFGWEWGVVAAPGGVDERPVAVAGCSDWSPPPATGNTPARNVGIVPFQTLGLDADMVRDAWGNFFTYAVSPSMARLSDSVPALIIGGAGTDDTGDVHARCLNGAWLEPAGSGDGLDSVSATKAKFCCLQNATVAPFDPANDIHIFALDGNAIWPDDVNTELYDNTRDVRPYMYDEVDSTAVGAVPYIDIPQSSEPTTAGAFIETPAFILISHGENQDGAYLANDTRNRYLVGGVGAGELENGAGTTADATAYDQNFVIGQPSLSGGATNFDDIVIWRTQNGIIAETGTSSCAYP